MTTGSTPRRHSGIPILIAILTILLLLLVRITGLMGDGLAGGDGLQLLGTAVVSIVVLIAALFVILSGKYADADKKWAYGAVGTIVGYWLNTH